MSRYLLELTYRGTRYAGWQRQPNALSVEQTLEEALSTVLGREIDLVGCGRTDAGVHASAYAAHLELDEAPPPRLLGRMNRFLPDDIALRALWRVPDDFHARFSATERGYRYHLSTVKDPLRPETVAWWPRADELDRDAMRTAAALLLEYKEFAPFCKTNHDAYTLRCELRESHWAFGETEWVYHVSANRFLRGMVRLIVGMCLEVGRGHLPLSDVRRALLTQTRLARPLSAPAAGLHLTKIRYSDRTDWHGVP